MFKRGTEQYTVDENQAVNIRIIKQIYVKLVIWNQYALQYTAHRKIVQKQT